MATSFRRKRNLLFKIVIGIPVLWFSFIGLSVVISGGPFPDVSRHSAPTAPESNAVRHVRDIHQNEVASDEDRSAPRPPHNPPPAVVVDPEQRPRPQGVNPDRERLQEAMQRDAELELRQREQDRRQQRQSTKDNKKVVVPTAEPNAPGEYPEDELVSWVEGMD